MSRPSALQPFPPSATSIAEPRTLALACHPDSLPGAVRRFDVRVGGVEGGVLALAFTLEGAIPNLRIPGPRPHRRADGLWRRTCFEAFVMAGEGPAYVEFNFSPSGEWATYAFRGYREGGEPGGDLVPGVDVHRDAGRLELRAAIREELLPRGRDLRLGLSAVLEEADGRLSYWALRHPPGRPDFHHADAFALRLAGRDAGESSDLAVGVAP